MEDIFNFVISKFIPDEDILANRNVSPDWYREYIKRAKNPSLGMWRVAINTDRSALVDMVKCHTVMKRDTIDIIIRYVHATGDNEIVQLVGDLSYIDEDWGHCRVRDGGYPVTFPKSKTRTARRTSMYQIIRAFLCC